MRFYTNQHKHYCGIDLHANKIYLCVIDSAGAVLLHKNIETEPAMPHIKASRQLLIYFSDSPGVSICLNEAQGTKQFQHINDTLKGKCNRRESSSRLMGNFWSQPLRVECKDKVQLCTSRTINGRLWFVNNRELRRKILPYLAKYQAKYRVKIYAFVIVGNHYHLLAQFPHGHRSAFFRDFNARIAEVVRATVPAFIGGPLFERRFTPQALPLDEDVEKYFLYCALQPVSSGLTQRISEYSEYNSCKYAISQTKETFKLFNYGQYNAAKRSNPQVREVEFTDEYTLEYSVLPHLAHLSVAEYRKVMLEKIETKRVQLVNDRLAAGKSFLGPEKLKEIVPGSLPRSSKKGGIRPIVLSCCQEAKREFLHWYFSVVEAYKRAVQRYRQGEFAVQFPPGTFRPHGMCISPP